MIQRVRADEAGDDEAEHYDNVAEKMVYINIYIILERDIIKPPRSKVGVRRCVLCAEDTRIVLLMIRPDADGADGAYTISI